jgi:hypothetical protein
MVHRRTKVVCIIAVGLLVLVSFALWIVRPGPVQEWRLPSIAKNLPADFKSGEATFNARVQARFPTGTKEEDLIGALLQDGFQIDNDNNRHS